MILLISKGLRLFFHLLTGRAPTADRFNGGGLSIDILKATGIRASPSEPHRCNNRISDETKLTSSKDYLYTDVSIYDYLRRLTDDGENIKDYLSIWYYF